MTTVAYVDAQPARGVVRDVPRFVAVLAFAVTLTLAVVQFLPALSVPRDSLRAEAAFVAAFVLHAGVGALIAWHRPANALGWLLLATGLCVVLTGALTAYAYRGLVADPGSLPGATWARWAQSWLFMPAFFGGLTVPLFLLPDGRLPSPRWRPVLVVVLVALAVATVIEAVRPGPIGETVPVDNPVGLAGWGPVLHAVETVTTATLIAGIGAGVLSLFVRWRDASGRVRHQLAWVLTGAAVSVALLSLALFLEVVSGLELFSALLAALAMAAPAAAIGLAVLRSRLLDIEVVAGRTLVWAAISCLSVLTYALALTATTRWASTEVGVALAILATATVALSLGALRQWIEPRLRTRLFGYRDQPYELLSGLGQTLTHEPMNDPGPTVAAWVRRHLGLAYAVVEHAPDPPDPRAPANAVRIPLELEGRRLGTLVVASSEGALSSQDRQVVEQVAHQASLAVLAHDLGAEVQRSRAALVRAREHERLRIRRDIHDGIGPTLAAIPLQLDAIAAGLEPGDDAREIADRIKAEVRSAVDDLRLLIEGLRPANLDHFGLRGAIEQRLRTVRDTGVAVSYELDPAVDEVSPAVEVVVLHVVSEGLTNVARHASAEQVRLDVRVEGEVVVVDLADDGVGLEGDPVAGVGLDSMRSRVAELEGTLGLSRGPLGGLRVLVRVPLEDR